MYSTGARKQKISSKLVGTGTRSRAFSFTVDDIKLEINENQQTIQGSGSAISGIAVLD